MAARRQLGNFLICLLAIIERFDQEFVAVAVHAPDLENLPIRLYLFVHRPPPGWRQRHNPRSHLNSERSIEGRSSAAGLTVR